jgi:phosphoglycolate phosphatase/putative hydrolase of the HAD superfamily
VKVFRLPQNLKTIIFDIDSTLYTNDAYAHEQVDVQIRRYAELQGISADAARAKVRAYRERWAAEHNGAGVSLGNTLEAFGIPIQTSIQWRRELLEPAQFLHPDPKLEETLARIKERFFLIAVTNNPVLPAQKTLSALGVASFIPEIIGLDTCGVSKPHKAPFLLAAEKTGVPAEHCLSVGDRYDIDIALPLELGMGGILVDGVKDVYELPNLLINSK